MGKGGDSPGRGGGGCGRGRGQTHFNLRKSKLECNTICLCSIPGAEWLSLAEMYVTGRPSLPMLSGCSVPNGLGYAACIIQSVLSTSKELYKDELAHTMCSGEREKHTGRKSPS